MSIKKFIGLCVCALSLMYISDVVGFGVAIAIYFVIMGVSLTRSNNEKDSPS